MVWLKRICCTFDETRDIRDERKQSCCSINEIQGRNEVYFFIADPVILPQFFILGSKRDENFDPLSRKVLLIQNA